MAKNSAILRHRIMPVVMVFVMGCGGSRPDSPKASAQNGPALVSNPNSSSDTGSAQPVAVSPIVVASEVPSTPVVEPSPAAGESGAVVPAPGPVVAAPDPTPPVVVVAPAPQVPPPVAPDWATIRDKVINVYCLKCHKGNAEVNFETYAGVKVEAADIQQDVFVLGTMPRGSKKLPEDLKALLKAWLDAGTPEIVAP